MNFTLFRILAVLRGGPADASTILRRLEDIAEGDELPSIPALYRHLRRGADSGWLELRPTNDDTPGRPAQEYELTPGGAEAVRSEAYRLERVTRLAIEGPTAGRR